MVSSYLVHHGYSSTAETFAKTTDQDFNEEITSIKNRQSKLFICVTFKAFVHLEVVYLFRVKMVHWMYLEIYILSLQQLVNSFTAGKISYLIFFLNF